MRSYVEVVMDEEFWIIHRSLFEFLIILSMSTSNLLNRMVLFRPCYIYVDLPTVSASSKIGLTKIRLNWVENRVGVVINIISKKERCLS